MGGASRLCAVRPHTGPVNSPRDTAACARPAGAQRQAHGTWSECGTAHGRIRSAPALLTARSPSPSLRHRSGRGRLLAPGVTRFQSAHLPCDWSMCGLSASLVSFFGGSPRRCVPSDRSPSQSCAISAAVPIPPAPPPSPPPLGRDWFLG